MPRNSERRDKDDESQAAKIKIQMHISFRKKSFAKKMASVHIEPKISRKPGCQEHGGVVYSRRRLPEGRI